VVYSLQTPSSWRCGSSLTVAFAIQCIVNSRCCITCNTCATQTTVDFEAQEDAFVAKLLVAEGANGVLVGQPILITVDEESDVAAFKDYELPAENKPAEEAAPAKEEKPAAENETAKKVPEKKEEVVTQPKPAAKRIEEPAQEPAKPAPKKQGTNYHSVSRMYSYVSVLR
jgi:pyruvate/2-oxoglutarate dehydrogenase complex dihydrolipoamide acyltransferase (E2) component